MIIKIGTMYINTDNVTYIIDREVYFNNDRTKIMSEPDLQLLLKAIYQEPKVDTVTVVEDPIVIKKPTVKKVTKK